MIRQNVGLIGAGNMGSAVVEGLFQKKLAKPLQVWVFDKAGAKTADFARQWKAHAAESSREIAAQCQIILLAVKPQDLEALGAELKEVLQKKHTVISILAGTPRAKLQDALGSQAQVVRAMPNLGAKVGESVTALCGGQAEALKAAQEVFSGCGQVLELEEKFFDLVTALSGSGPAYFFHLMELLIEKGVEQGLSPAQARRLAVGTAAGAAKLVQASEDSPAAWRERVTSKGGTTEAALNVLKEKQFRSIFLQALQAALERGKELSQ